VVRARAQPILIALQRDYEGTVTILGKDLRQWNADYYERVGVSFEFPNHYLKFTARENLELFRGFYGLVPSYWPMKIVRQSAAEAAWPAYALAGLVMNGLFVGLLLRRLNWLTR
jgi:hypothetical protein